MKIKKGDEVKIIAGKDKGKSGKVEKVFSKEEQVLVQGVNQYKRHLKARSKNQKSEIVTITKPLSFANIRIICPKCNVPTRIGYKIEKDAKKRVCRKCDQTID